MRYAVRHKGQEATASGLDVLAGIWVLISPWALAYHHMTYAHMAYATTVDVVLGIIIGILALIRFFSNHITSTAWISWINTLLGICLLISPWVFGFSSHAVPMWNNVIFGIVVIVLGSWSAVSSDSRPTGSPDDMQKPM